MALHPVAGMKIYIGGVLSDKSTDFIASDFSSQVWTEIDGWETMGTLDDTAQEISTSLINRGRDQTQKGTAKAPSMQNQFAIIANDPGQLALIAAAAPSNKNNYAFKIEGNDSLGGSNSLRLFIALAMGAGEQGGSANTIQKLNGTIAINSNIVHVAAT
jgi:archaellum component FlaG (FlaF/FlaG flagellin family)